MLRNAELQLATGLAYTVVVGPMGWGEGVAEGISRSICYKCLLYPSNSPVSGIVTYI